MGTTMVLPPCGRTRALANVGDSRAYFATAAKYASLPEDQLYVQHLLTSAKLRRRRALKHPQRNIIMQAVGVSTAVSPDVYTFDYNGETLLLCPTG